MRIIILGAGRVGESVAETLVSEANDITVVDPDPERLRRLEDRLDLRGVTGNGIQPSVLRGAGAQDCDLFIACTPQDETNLVACKIAHDVFGIPTTIARLRSPEFRQGDKLLEKDGSIDCFDVQNGAVYCVAMYDMRLQELYRFAEGKLTRLSSWNDDFFLTKPPVIPQPLQFINSDGVQIDGFVMTPTDHVPGKKTPVILDIHGGPHLTYGAVYYHEMQYWANHGYYVIYCNPRGGESRGNEFGYICGRFGTIDYDDIMAFCDEALKAYPDMDEKHMGVTGGSYGGFMTNWIIGHTNRFAAAASQRGIANFVSMEGTSDIGTLFAERQILATTHTNLEKMWKQSPLKYADRCTTPTLFIHSEEDYRCWMVEALQMYSTLIHHGVPTRLCLFHGENHELSRGGKPKGRIRRLQEITAWMDKYLKEE